jgi:hypothetical protein
MQNFQHQFRSGKEPSGIYIASLTLCDHFHLSITEASKTLQIGLGILKKKCQRYGIPPLASPEIKSLDLLIQDLEVIRMALSIYWKSIII